MEPSDALEALRILVSPTLLAKGSPETGTGIENSAKNNGFDGSLAENIEQVHQHLQTLLQSKMDLIQLMQHLTQTHGVTSMLDDCTETFCRPLTDVRWQFVKCNLKLLLLLKSTTDIAMKSHKTKTAAESVNKSPNLEHHAPPLSPDTLSFAQQKLVMTSVQFIACLGLCPNFLVGVGIPIERRSGFGQLLKNSCESNISNMEKDYRLWLCVRNLMECAKQPSLGGIILSRHLGDILASLIQICYAPMKAKQQAGTSETLDESVVGRNKAKLNIKENDADLGACDVQLSSGLSSCKIGVDTKSKAGVDFNNENSAHGENQIKSEQNKPIQVGNTDDPSINNDTLSQLPTAPTPVSTVCLSKNSTGNSRLLRMDATDRKDAESQLQKIVANVYHPMLIRELLLLQGGAGTRPPTKSQVTSSSAISRPPAWLRRVCGRILSDCLVSSKGVQHMLQAVLDAGAVTGSPSSQKSSMDWRKCNSVAKIIASCPAYVTSKERYMEAVVPQVLELLHVEDKLVGPQYLRVAVETLSLILEQDPGLAQKYVVKPLISPFLKCLEENVPEVDEPKIFIQEIELQQCITDIHKVFTLGASPHSTIFNILTPVIQILFKMYSFVRQGVAPVRTQLRKLLVTYFKQAESTNTLTMLDSFVSEELMNPRLMLTAGSTGGVVVLLVPEQSSTDIMKESETVASALVEVIQHISSEEMSVEFFLVCLKHLTNIVSEEVDDDSLTESSSAPQDKTLLELPQTEADIMKKLGKNLIILSLLDKMCKNMGPNCLKSAKHILEFVKVTLERCVKVLDNAEDVAFGVFEGETVTLAMGLLASLLGGEVELVEGEREFSKQLLPLLQRIKDCHPDPLIQQLASSLHIGTATHGHITEDQFAQFVTSDGKIQEEYKKNFNKNDQKSNRNKSPISTKQKLIEEVKIDNTSLKDETEMQQKIRPETKEHRSNHKKSDTPVSKASLQEALKDLRDPLIPVQGHALITLKHLVEQKDKETIQKKQLVLEIFLENLKHTDSYIYLAAIQGLSVLADTDTDHVLDILVKEFIGQEQQVNPSVTLVRTAEQRMKIGEVLVKTSKNLGEMAPKYRDVLLGAFLNGTRDEDYHIRASSLSNMGELCKLLKFALGNIIYEILECVSALLKTDQEVAVRRSAALFTTLLLRGLGKDMLKVIDNGLRDLYRLLKLVATIEKDETVILHVQLSLEELELQMKDFIFPKQSLEKKLHIRNSPDF